MPDVFISHSTKDAALAKQIYSEIERLGGTAFLAPFSIQPGNQWSPKILANLTQAKVVLFLASKAACESPFVNQELGGALALNKRIIPVIWEVTPSQLPGWTTEFQAIDVRQGTENLRAALESIVKELKLKRENNGLLVAGLGLVLLLVLSKD